MILKVLRALNGTHPLYNEIGGKRAARSEITRVDLK